MSDENTDPAQTLDPSNPFDPSEPTESLATPEPAFPLHRIVEAILFASQKPVSAKELSNFLKGAAEAAKEDPSIACYSKVKAPQLQDAIEQLEKEFAETGRAFEIRESAAGWQLVTKADFAPWLRQLFPENRQARLSAPAMETLAIIAYRQPITRADIEAVRGVAVDGVMQTLLDRNLIRIAGRAEIAGRPLLYETTQFFMEHFGLKNLDDLPNATELRRIPLPKAEPPAAEESPATSPTPEPPPAEEGGTGIPPVIDPDPAPSPAPDPQS
jgi:segregation and condensation protein B